MAFDVTLFHAINNLSAKSDSLDALGIFAAVFLLPMLGVLLILAAFTIKRFKEEHWYELPLRAFVAGAAAYAIKFVVGALVARPRPFVSFTEIQNLIDMETAYNSFPSGHASIAFAFAFIVYKADRDWGIAFLILAALVSLGRVFVGVHYPLDIIGGAVVGWFAAWIVNKLERVQWSKLERAMRVR
ncbi:hypothetical protein A3B21_01710 [Candidatus Uhrbacteria bacterium RIFCSPLOWO2_01_FULL_47_24]|uniref:Phosphatidic acid phosphatase type 2/haloperoxidase domain-containing protein n=1 Tax=Candidatus Uhrbacteria bacterium RIFCSPLOWO2_01_FULL_47_24 TaxID=1802401 RepID=A0A1F7UP48_9BACT|nr:MAG: hypothetical protein A2753_04275 [Candidatus Uhrbacteria bacterium RIFCSPHIGHO2_01_FULL_47_11]OGL67884.1 MAG: hypothetical protein A3D58_04905 [Candidatus Uhrbacteria bacterium RIFCSPHIGHO2_02_FULL_46_47]OGL75761.1 MAG: hypothetical protein A3F52_04970 [Candidatus Uhrbacteria bacterium RIFCSPHIGHO2_12_FULL_47_11]OGL80070.1 MAG: hypothetical protein A3B21_01710 [Candidatus Uhrbacteria bacterium RIFCSPLOWO2_01_FULL_47_24]OGL84856.1 MAG: hypothetical protein A3J03_04095 [Candidatus Uhrbact